MLYSKTRTVLVSCGLAMVLLAPSPWSKSALAAWPTACSSCVSSPASAITYARPYTVSRVGWLPSYGISPTYRMAAYGSTTACNPCSASAVTTYRPVVAYRPIVARPFQPVRGLIRLVLSPFQPRQAACYTPTMSCYSPTSCTSCYTPASCTTSCDPCGGGGSICGPSSCYAAGSS